MVDCTRSHRTGTDVWSQVYRFNHFTTVRQRVPSIPYVSVWVLETSRDEGTSPVIVGPRYLRVYKFIKIPCVASLCLCDDGKSVCVCVCVVDVLYCGYTFVKVTTESPPSNSFKITSFSSLIFNYYIKLKVELLYILWNVKDYETEIMSYVSLIWDYKYTPKVS